MPYFCPYCAYDKGDAFRCLNCGQTTDIPIPVGCEAHPHQWVYELGNRRSKCRDCPAEQEDPTIEQLQERGF